MSCNTCNSSRHPLSRAGAGRGWAEWGGAGGGVTARIHSQVIDWNQPPRCHVYCLGRSMVRHCSWGRGGGKVRASQRAMGARRTFGASIDEALQELEPALAPPAIVRWGRVRGSVCVPSRRPRAHATGRRALSLLLRGHMWAHLRKPTAGRSQRVGLVKRRGVRAVHGAAGRGRPSVSRLPEGWVHTGLAGARPADATHSLTHNFRNHPPGA